MRVEVLGVMDWIFLIFASSAWSLLWGALSDRIYLGTDMFTLLFIERKLEVDLRKAIIRSVLWLFFLSLGNFVISGIVCGEFSFEKIIGTCMKLKPKLQAFVGFSYIVALTHIIPSILEQKVGWE